MRSAAQSFWLFCSAALLVSCNGLRTDERPETDAARRAQIESMYEEYRQEFPDVAEITPQDFRKLQQASDTVLVDVRTPEEQAVSMLPGAITLDAFEAAKDTYRDQTIVTYCTIGARSGECAKELKAEGFKARNLKGSILAWTHAGLPLFDKDGQPTKRVHTYGKQWNLVADGYDATW